MRKTQENLVHSTRDNANIFSRVTATVTLVLFFGACTTTQTREVPVYEDVTEEVEYEETVEEEVNVPPIVEPGDIVLAFTRVGGRSQADAESIADSIRVGFMQVQAVEESDYEGTMDFVSRGRLTRVLSRSQLDDMGSDVEQTLQNEFGVNVVTTGTVLNEPDERPRRLLIEVIDFRNNQFHEDIITADDWDEVGADVARTFFGTRTDIVEETVVRTREEVVDRRQTGTREQEYEEFSLLATLLGGGLILLLIAVISEQSGDDDS